jgi:PAS domain S-box-containing protein
MSDFAKLVSELEKTTKHIEEERAKADALFVSIGDGAIATDEQGKIRRINQPALDLLGYKSADDVVGVWYPKIIKAETEQGKPIGQIELPITRALLSGKSVSARIYYQKPDGDKLPAHVTVSPILLAGKPIGAVEVFRDITQELELEKTKSEFISLASHQLKTPPGAIKWNLELLLDGTLGALTDEQMRVIQDVHNVAGKMTETVSALLNVSRLELGTFTVEPKPVSYVSVIHDVLKELRPQISAKALQVHESYDSEIPDIPADPGLARIIIENVVSNAVKYTPEKGEVFLSIVNTPAQIPKSILITVKDSGYGIPREQHGKIFDKMFRADNIIEKADGTGFGLYLLKSIVELAGGKVWFESEENKGTTFFIDLPYSGMHAKKGTSKITD